MLCPLEMQLMGNFMFYPLKTGPLLTFYPLEKQPWGTCITVRSIEKELTRNWNTFYPHEAQGILLHLIHLGNFITFYPLEWHLWWKFVAVYLETQPVRIFIAFIYHIIFLSQGKIFFKLRDWLMKGLCLSDVIWDQGSFSTILVILWWCHAQHDLTVKQPHNNKVILSFSL